jgi:hypothetical protein
MWRQFSSVTHQMKVQMIRVAKFVSFSLLPCVDLSGEFFLQFVPRLQTRPSAVEVENDFLGRTIMYIANFSVFLSVSIRVFYSFFFSQE